MKNVKNTNLFIEYKLPEAHFKVTEEALTTGGGLCPHLLSQHLEIKSKIFKV